MPTFRFNSERPYYQDGRLMKKVTAQHSIRLSGTDCAVLGFSAARLLGKLTYFFILLSFFILIDFWYMVFE